MKFFQDLLSKVVPDSSLLFKILILLNVFSFLTPYTVESALHLIYLLLPNFLKDSIFILNYHSTNFINLINLIFLMYGLSFIYFLIGWIFYEYKNKSIFFNFYHSRALIEQVGEILTNFLLFAFLFMLPSDLINFPNQNFQEKSFFVLILNILIVSGYFATGMIFVVGFFNLFSIKNKK